MARTTRKPKWTVEEAERQLAITEDELAWAEDYVERMKVEIARRKKEIEVMSSPGWAPKKSEYPMYRYGM